MMKRRPFRTVLTELARRDDVRELFVKADDSVNASQLADALGVTQATISRALSNPNYQPRKDLIDSISRYFNISAAQARGEETLVGSPEKADQLTARARNFAKRFDALHAPQKKLLEDMLGQFEQFPGQQQAG